MKIGINASYAASEKPTGIGNYIINLINGFQQADLKDDLFLLYRWKIKKNRYLKSNLPIMKFEPGLNWLFKHDLDVFHDPSFKYIKMGKSKNIITVHDTVVALKEDYTSAHFKKQQFPKYVKAVKRSDKIITVSDFSKSEIIKYFSVDPDKINVVYHGVDHNFFKPGMRNKDILSKYNLPERYILFIGHIEKRKNLINMVKSFEIINKKEKDLYFVIIGKDGYGAKEIREFIKQSSSRTNIIERDYIPNEELPQFYHNAELLFFPTLYEGFGLPILEAQACGCQVVTSSISAMPEAGGDDAVYTDPFNINDIAEKTINLLQNSKLKADLIKKGISHAKNFTWKKTAEETINIYKEIKKIEIRNFHE